MEIDAGLTQVGELSLGSLLLSASRDGVSSLQLEFGSELTARASFDIYGGTEGQRLSATLEVSRTLDGPAMATVPLALSRADDSRVVATGTVPLGALAPGDYVVRGHHPSRERHDRARGEDAEESSEVGTPCLGMRTSRGFTPFLP